MKLSLLIISCSQRKVAVRTMAAAWEVYDGVVYRVLKKRLGPRKRWPAAFDVLIVSAKYGVIRPGRRIEPYDQIMSRQGESGRWAVRLRRLVAGREYRFVHVNLGQAYLAAIGDVACPFPNAEVTFATGGIGQRASQTGAWVDARISVMVTSGRESPSSRSRRPSRRIPRRNSR